MGVVGLAWEFWCRVVPIVLFCGVVLAAVVGGLWLIGRVALTLGGKKPAQGGWRFFKVGVEMR